MNGTSSGTDGAQGQWHAFAEYVRRALHDAVKHIEPQADALEPIRARIPAWSGARDLGAARRRRRARASPEVRGSGPRRHRS
jgi:hypothetical protein